MSIKKLVWLILSLTLILVAVTPSVLLAGGLTQYEVATPDVGYASAGYAARADDPGTVLTNPAGITRLKGAQLHLGGQFLYGDVEFSPHLGTTGFGNNGGNSLGFVPAVSLFGTYQVNPKVSIGIGMFSNFGLGVWYDSSWIGRYYVKDALLMGMSLTPVVAYRINEQLSIGAGPNIMFAFFRQRVAINNLDPRFGDGQLEVKDKTIGIGANVGILYELSKGTRFGATYTSPINLNFSNTPQFNLAGPGLSALLLRNGTLFSTLDVGMTVPQAVMASFYHEFDDKWALLGNFGWQNWSKFGKVDISLSSTSNPNGLTTNLKYEDSWHGALGAQYRISAPWLITAGVAYDSSIMGEANRSPSLPLGWAWRFALGTQWDVRNDLRIGIAYEYLYAGSPRINVSRGPLAGTVTGAYNDMSIQYFTINATWKF